MAQVYRNTLENQADTEPNHKIRQRADFMIRLRLQDAFRTLDWGSIKNDLMSFEYL